MDNEKSVQKSTNIEKPWLFQKGNPGGPGRPKGSGLRSRTMKLLGEYLANDEKVYLKDFYERFFEAAKDQDTWQAKVLAQMILGPDMFDRYDDWVERGEKAERAFL